MHPLGIEYEEYMTALAVNKIQDPHQKAMGIKKWEKETGHKFPWGFPNVESLLFESGDWEDTINSMSSLFKKQ
ncbi:MAG: hypothetical protein PHX25_00750 [Candidatus Pacebacteria bacterium]|nr:hypothetical protein [Candidatus Paceibacterota bacterium]